MEYFLEESQLLSEGIFKKKPKLSPEEQKQKEWEADLEEAEEAYNDFLNWWKKPYTLGGGYDVYILNIAYCLNINENAISTKFLKFNKPNLYFKHLGLYEDEIQIAKKYIKEPFVELLGNDDYSLIINPYTKKIIELISGNPFQVNPYKMNCGDLNPDAVKEVINKHKH